MTLLCMPKGFSYLNGEAVDCDVTVILLTYINVNIKERLLKEPQGSVQLNEFSSSLGFSREGHRPSVLANLVSLMEKEYKTIQGGVPYWFILSIYSQGWLGHLKLISLSCLCISWVACHPASIKPGIREARITAFWRQIALSG